MSIYFYLAFMAAFSLIIGFQWSARQRKKSKCKTYGHQWRRAEENEGVSYQCKDCGEQA